MEADCEYDWLGRASLETERESTHNPFHDSGVSVGDALAITAGHAISPTSPKTQRRRHPPVSMHTAKNSLGRRLELASQSEQMRSPPSESFVTPPTAVETEPELVFAPTVGDATKNTSLLAPAPLDIGISFPHSPSLLLPHDFSSAPSSDLDADADAVTSRLSIDINSFFYEQQGTVFPALDFSVLTRLSAPRDSTSTSTATHSYRSSAEVEGEVEGVLNGDGAALRSSGGSSTSLATSVDEVKDGRGVELFTSTSASGGRREHSASISSASFSSNPFSAYIEPAPARGLTPIEAFPLPPVSPPLPEPEPASASTSIAEEPLNLELALARQEAETRLLPPSPSPSACAQGEAMASRHGRKGSVPLMSAGVTRGEVMEGKEGRDGKEKDGKEKDGKDGRKGRVRSSTVGSRGKSAYGLFPSASAVNSGAPF